MDFLLTLFSLLIKNNIRILLLQTKRQMLYNQMINHQRTKKTQQKNLVPKRKSLTQKLKRVQMPQIMRKIVVKIPPKMLTVELLKKKRLRYVAFIFVNYTMDINFALFLIIIVIGSYLILSLFFFSSFLGNDFK